MGDPSGIGPSIIKKTIGKLSGEAEFTVIGDRRVFDKAGVCCNKTEKIRFIDLHNVHHKKFSFGKVRAEYGRASVEYLDKALELIRNKKIDCIVTCPISKEAINLAGFKYSGHTEYFSEHTKTRDIVMMLLNKELKISLVTRHIPLRDVPLNCDKEKIYKTIFLTSQELKRLFRIKKPRIAVCGLNPHASDNGIIGDEEARIIKPAVKKISKLFTVEGPLPADVALARTIHKQYDCAVAMYHDQALIPLKLSDGFTGVSSAVRAKARGFTGGGVNVTLGLPFVRTSPLHGTAFDIAGNYSLINPSSFIEAINIAIECVSNILNP